MLGPLLEKALLAAFEKLWPLIAEKITALLPVLVASIVKLLGDQLKTHLPQLQLPDVSVLPQITKGVLDKIIDADPDLPGISNIFDLTEYLKKLGL